MANQFLYYYRNIAGNTDNVKILYTFDNNLSLIQNDASPSNYYQGSIYGSSLTFYKNQSGSFNNSNYVGISHGILDPRIEPNQFTIFFDFYRQGDQRGGLFSTATSLSGFTFGINDINRFYIDIPQKKETHVFQTLFPARYNTIALTKNRHSFSLYLFDPTNNSSDSETWECDFSALPNNPGTMYIGRDNVNAWNYSGYIGQFAYIDRNLSKNVIHELFSGFKPETLSATGYGNFFNNSTVNDSYNSFSANEEASLTLVSKEIGRIILTNSVQSNRINHWTGSGDFTFSSSIVNGSILLYDDIGSNLVVSMSSLPTSGANFTSSLIYEHKVDADKSKLITHSTYTISGKKVFVDQDFNIFVTGGIPVLDSTGWVNAYKMDGMHFYPRKFLTGQFFDSSKTIIYSTGQSNNFNNEATYSIVAGYYKTNNEGFSQVIINEDHKSGLYNVSNNNIIGPTGTNKTVHYSNKVNYSSATIHNNVSFDGRVSKPLFRKFGFVTGIRSSLGYQCLRNIDLFETAGFDGLYEEPDFSAFQIRPYMVHNNTEDDWIS